MNIAVGCDRIVSRRAGEQGSNVAVERGVPHLASHALFKLRSRHVVALMLEVPFEALDDLGQV